MLTTHKQETTTDAPPRWINKRSTRITAYSSLLLIYCLVSFWNFSNTHLSSYEKCQLTGLIFIALGSFFSIVFQFVKHEILLFENMGGTALIGGGFIYFIGICLQIRHECYCSDCHHEFECGCGIFGTGVIIFGTSVAVGIDVVTNFLNYQRIRLVTISSILFIGALFILINRFQHHLSGIKTIEEIGWVFIAVACILIIIFIAIMGLATYQIYNGFVALLLFIGGGFVLVGGIGGYTSSDFHSSYNATIWVFYLLVCFECVLLALDVFARHSREYQPLK